MFSFTTALIRLTILILVVLTLNQSSLAETSSLVIRDSVDLQKTLLHNGLARKYVVHLPPIYNGRKYLPLVIMLHGGGVDLGGAKRMSDMSAKADKEGFIVVYPNGTGRLKNHFLTWNALDCCGYAKARKINDVDFIASLIDTLKRDFAVDSSKIFVAGFSNGGMLAYLLACRLSHKIAAIACVGGSMSGKEPLPTEPVSVIIFHSLDDQHVPYNGGKGILAKFGYPVNQEPVSYAVNFWTKHNKCLPVTSEEKGSIVHQKYSSGVYDSDVELYTVKDSGHSWPGGTKNRFYSSKPTAEIHATNLIWEFFSQHPKHSLLVEERSPNSSSLSLD